MEVEGAFLIGIIAALNYLGCSRLLELVRIDDMVRDRERLMPTARAEQLLDARSLGE